MIKHDKGLQLRTERNSKIMPARPKKDCDMGSFHINYSVHCLYITVTPNSCFIPGKYKKNLSAS